MKRLLILLAAVALLFGMTMPAQATLVTITFDEPGISSGPYYPNPELTDPRDDGDIITNQYDAQGLNWVNSPLPGAVPSLNYVTTGYESGYTIPSEAFTDADGNYQGHLLWYYNNYGWIELDASADSLEFQLRRPKSSGDIFLKVYDTTSGSPVLVYDFGKIGWTAGSGWVTFDSDSFAAFTGTFDAIYMSSGSKFYVDNLSVNMVPIPASFWLLATGLIPIIRRLKR